MGNKLSDDILKWTLDVNGKPAMKELNDVEQSTRQLEQTNKDLRVEMQKMEAAGKKNTKGYKDLQKQMSLNNKTIKANKTQMAALRKELGVNHLTAKQLRSEYKRLKNQMDNLRPNSKEWKKLDGEMKAVKDRMGELNAAGGKTNKMFGSLKGLLPVLGIGAVVGMVAKLGKKLYNLAIQLEGDNRRATIVFGDSLKYVEDQAKTLSQQMGLTNKEFVAAAANTADLLIPLDFTREASAKMSVELQSMAGALDEWTGGRVGAAEVSNILTKAMLGENEQLKTLGIAIRKDSEEFRDLVKVKLETTGVTKAQAEAMATLELIQKKSADAQTAYLQEGNKLLRWQKTSSRLWKQMKEDVVTYVTEGLKSASTIFNEQAKSVKNLEDNIVPLISEYENLSEKSELSESEQSKLNDIIVTIGSNLPGAITQFDEYGKVIGISADKAKELIEQQKAMLLVKNADAIKEQEDALDRVNKLMTMYSHWVTSGIKGVDEFGNKIKLTTEETEKWTTELEKLGQQKLGIEGLLKTLKGEPLINPEDPDNAEKVTKTIKTLKEELSKLKTARESINIEDKVALDQNKQQILDLEKLIKKYEAVEPVIKKAKEAKQKGHEMLLAFDINYLSKRKNIYDAARVEDVEAIQDAFELETTIRNTNHQNALAALGNDIEARTELDTKFKEDEKLRMVAHLEGLMGLLDDQLKSGGIEGLNLADAMLSDEDKEILFVKIAELQELIATLKAEIAGEEEDEENIGGAITTFLFGKDWQEMDLSEKIQAVGDLTIKTLNDINQIITNAENQQMMNYKKNMSDRKKLLNKQLNDGIISYEEYTARTAALDEELDTKKRKIAHDQAVRAKVLGIFQAVVNTAVGITSMLKDPGGVAGIVLAVLAGLLGALQVGIIASEPVPQYALGNFQDVIGQQTGKTYKATTATGNTGIYSKPTLIPGLGLVGEEDSELVFSGADTRKMLNSPPLIDAIGATINASQYANGNAGSVIRETTVNNNGVGAEELAVLSDFATVMTDIKENGIQAFTVLDEDHHKNTDESKKEYDAFQERVN